jgi:hypothetical protein
MMIKINGNGPRHPVILTVRPIELARAFYGKLAGIRHEAGLRWR